MATDSTVGFTHIRKCLLVFLPCLLPYQPLYFPLSLHTNSPLSNPNANLFFSLQLRINTMYPLSMHKLELPRAQGSKALNFNQHVAN